MIPGLLDVSPAAGAMHSVLSEQRAFASSPCRSSPYLDLCEEKPDILLKLNRKVPSKPHAFQDPSFRAFLKDTKYEVPVPEHLWAHSSQSFKAWQKAIAKYHRKLPEVKEDDDFVLAEEWTLQICRQIVGTTVVTPFWKVCRETELSRAPGPLHRPYVGSKAEFLDHPDCKE